MSDLISTVRECGLCGWRGPIGDKSCPSCTNYWWKDLFTAEPKPESSPGLLRRLLRALSTATRNPEKE